MIEMTCEICGHPILDDWKCVHQYEKHIAHLEAEVERLKRHCDYCLGKQQAAFHAGRRSTRKPGHAFYAWEDYLRSLGEQP